MNAIYQVLSNLKHNGDLMVKGTVFEAPVDQFEQLVADGVLRIVEGVSTVAEATDKLAQEAETELEAAGATDAAASQDTWAPTKDPIVAPDLSGQTSEVTTDAVKTDVVEPVLEKFNVLKEFEITNAESKNFGKHAVGDVIEADPAAAAGLVADGTLEVVPAVTGDTL